jgi:glycosyltransferase involved in cell wall biosynthesis
MYLVAECTTISAPNSSGRCKAGEQKQLSTASNTPRSRAKVGERIEVVNNFYAEDVDPERATPAKAYDILYAGNHGPGQNLAFFIEALARCRPESSPRIVFYGGGTEKEALRKLARERAARKRS